MTIEREFLSGDRGRFAFKLAFHADPDEGRGATHAESLSWGSFEVWAGGQNLCEHSEQGDVVSAVHWYMLPWLEWLVANWDYLLHESRLPVRNAAADAWDSLAETAFPPDWLELDDEGKWRATWTGWWNRHCILAARQGGLFPNVFIRRWQDLVELSWGPVRLAGQPPFYRFLASKGFRRYGVEEVSSAFFDVIEGAVSHLRKTLPHSERIEALERSARALAQTSVVKRVAILSQFDEERWTGIEREAQHEHPEEAFQAIFTGDATALAVTGAGSAALMFGCTSPTLSANDIRLLVGRLIELYSHEGESEDLAKLVHPEPLESSDARPWHQGYKLADDFLETCGLVSDETEFIDVEGLCQGLGVQLRPLPLEDREIRAIAIAGPHHSPAVCLNEHHDTFQWPSGKRFSLAHELCHLLYDRSYGRRLALASGPWAPRDLERRANSFAAELLMPAELVRRLHAKMEVPLASCDAILRLSNRMHTSFTATLEHIANLRLISESERDQVRNEADDRQSQTSI
jgi:Zn-dependent peptidase ImmA (M78 family)